MAFFRNEVESLEQECTEKSRVIEQQQECIKRLAEGYQQAKECWEQEMQALSRKRIKW